MDHSPLGSSKSVGLSRQEYWSGLPFPPPGNLSHSGIETSSLASPALQTNFLPLSHQGSHWEFLKGIPFAVQWLGLHISTTGCSIPGQGTIILQAAWSSQKKKKKINKQKHQLYRVCPVPVCEFHQHSTSTNSFNPQDNLTRLVLSTEVEAES